MNMQSRVVGIVALIAVILALGASTTRFAQIDEGTRGIIVTQGAVESIQEPGLFFRPFAPFTRVEIVNVRRQSRQIQQNVASSDKQLYDINIQV
ncbi:MAG: SPFH domain-containing protein, partial [Roseiflexaceae bacterium]